MAYDLPAIRRQNPISEVAANRGLRLTRRGNEYNACCPFHDEKSASFTIFKGGDGLERFQCFSAACGAKGTVIDYVMQHDGVDLPTACAILGGEREAPTGSRPAPKPQTIKKAPAFTYGTAPADAPLIEAGKRTMEIRNPGKDEDGKPGYSSYSPSMVFPYRDRAGALLGYVLRQDLKDGGKITPGIWWMRSEEEGFEGWCHGRPRPSPLYGLDQLALYPTKQVIVVEGEKAADALRTLLDVCVVTWVGGSNGVEHADWSPLAGRQVILWGDADQAGESAMLGSVKRDAWSPGVVEFAHKAGAAWVKFAPWDKTKPEKWDAADAKAGIMTDKATGEILWQSETGPWDKNTLLAWVRARLETWEPKAPAKVMPLPEKPKPVEPKAEPAIEARTLQQIKPNMDEVNRDELERKRQQKLKEAEERRKAREAAAAEEEANAWKAELLYNDEEKLKPKSTKNYLLFLTHHPDVKGVFVYNEFARETFVMRRPPWEKRNSDWQPRKINDHDAVHAAAWLETMGMSPRVSEIAQAITTAAQEIRVNPVLDYFRSLKWDGAPRLSGGMLDGASYDAWVVRYLGVPDEPIYATFGTKWLISAVARAFKPGCKVDPMIVLEGDQNLRKSTVLRTLATFGGGVFYTDQIRDIGSTTAAQELQGVLIVELAEMAATGRAEERALKGWITTQVDRFRPPYGRFVQEFPRVGVLAATFNPQNMGWLSDASGDRRYWPLPCRAVTESGHCDAEGIAADLDQLWAEAVHRFNAGEIWWLTKEEEEQAREIQGDRYEDDIWATPIDEYLEAEIKAGRGAYVFSTAILNVAINKPVEKQTAADQRRVARHMKKIGWERKKVRPSGSATAKWAFVPKGGL
jgi:predicted P-loop ATPase